MADYLYSFCNRQSNFIKILGKLRIIKCIEAYYVPNPITGRTEAYIQKCEIPKFLKGVITFVELNLVDDEGRARMDRLESCGMLKTNTQC